MLSSLFLRFKGYIIAAGALALAVLGAIRGVKKIGKLEGEAEQTRRRVEAIKDGQDAEIKEREKITGLSSGDIADRMRRRD
jgi:hypothetical protein